MLSPLRAVRAASRSPLQALRLLMWPVSLLWSAGMWMQT